MRKRLKDGRWYAMFKHEGRYIGVSLNAYEREERKADIALGRLSEKLERGEYIGRDTFREVAGSFKNQDAPGIKKMVLFFDKLRVKKISAENFVEYKNWRENNSKATKGTLNKEWLTFRLIVGDMLPGLEKPKMDFVYHGKVKRISLTETQIDSILSKLITEYRNVAFVAAYSGLRLSDIIDLRWSEVNFAECLIRRKQGKTTREVTIPMCNKLRKALTGINMRSIKRADHVFPGIKSTSVTQAFRRASRKSGCKEFSFHDLRHFFCSFQANAGVPTSHIKSNAGHSSEKTTEIYTHIDLTSQRKAVSVFDKVQNEIEN